MECLAGVSCRAAAINEVEFPRGVAAVNFMALEIASALVRFIQFKASFVATRSGAYTDWRICLKNSGKASVPLFNRAAGRQAEAYFPLRSLTVMGSD